MLTCDTNAFKPDVKIKTKAIYQKLCKLTSQSLIITFSQ